MRRAIFFCFSLIFLTGPVEAQVADSSKTAPQTHVFGQRDSASISAFPVQRNTPENHLWRVVGVTLLLLVILIAGMGFYKKYILRQSAGHSSRIRVVARQALGPKQSILIVHIDGQKYALSSAENNIRLIDHMGKADSDEAVLEANQPGFNNLVKKLSQQK